MTVPISIHTLASKCQVAPRTMYRDLSALIEAGVPIVYDDRRRGYVLACLSPSPVRVTQAEVLGLLLMIATSPAQAFTSPAAAVLELLPKLMDGLRSEQRLELQAVFDALPMAEPGKQASSATSQFLGPLLEGIRHRHDMRLNYRITPDGPSASTRITAPYHLNFTDGNWCIEARSSQHRCRRHFSLDRLVSIQVLSAADCFVASNSLRLTSPGSNVGKSHSIT